MRTIAQTSSNRHQMRSSGIGLRQRFITATCDTPRRFGRHRTSVIVQLTTLPMPTIMLSKRLIHAPVEPSPSEN